MIKLKEPARLEFLIVSGFMSLAFLLSILDLFLFKSSATFTSSIEMNGNQQMSFNSSRNLLIPILFQYLIIYISYLMLCFYLIPEFEKKGNQTSGNTLFVLLFISTAIFIGLIPSYFALLLAIKMLFIFFNRDKRLKENSKYYEATLIATSWIFIIAALSFLPTSRFIELYVLLVLPFVFIIYLYAMYHLIPVAMTKKWKFLNYFTKMLLFAAGSSLIIAAIIGIIYESRNHINIDLIAIGSSLTRTINIQSIQLEQDISMPLSFSAVTNFFTQLLILIPLTWNIYKSRNRKKEEEITTLKTELGKSDATLNFLKSQINPHFLFNALNTLYGTALQEKAERTGEGIQKLGDMMRFMLQENIEDQILLSKDVDYLNNYISLQKLRIAHSSDITIETQIEEQINNLQIAPMLLIPFVENAFKHGISLKEPSHIKITLQTKENKLYFDVHNSIHIKSDHDPEKLHSGIGLNNVKERLKLQYPEQHELIIRENAKEFFVHLTLQLTSIN